MTIYDLEKRVMEKLLQGEEPVLKRLRSQYNCASIVSIQHTGVGFYLQYLVPEQQRNFPANLHFCFGDVQAYINDAVQPVGFLLWISDGKLDFLEGYTYDMPWPENIIEFELEYFDEPRDLRKLPEINVD